MKKFFLQQSSILAACIVVSLFWVLSGCTRTEATSTTALNEDVGLSMTAFEAAHSSLDAVDDDANAGTEGTIQQAATAGGGTGPDPVVEINVSQEATINAKVDLDNTNLFGGDRFPNHTGTIDYQAQGTVIGSFSDSGEESFDGSVDFGITSTVDQDVVYHRGEYTATIGSGSNVVHSLLAEWAQVGVVHTHSVTARRTVNNLDVSVSGPTTSGAALINSDLTLSSVFSN